jgi:hypothetical protein
MIATFTVDYIRYIFAVSPGGQKAPSLTIYRTKECNLSTSKGRENAATLIVALYMNLTAEQTKMEIPDSNDEEEESGVDESPSHTTTKGNNSKIIDEIKDMEPYTNQTADSSREKSETMSSDIAEPPESPTLPPLPRN